MKSKEEILKDNGIYLGFSSSYTGDGILSAMEKYASQQAPSSTPPVSADDMTAEEFFNHPDGMFTLNFLTKEEQETLYKAIDLFVVGKIRQAMLSAPISAMYSKELCEWISGRYTFLYGRWVINNEIYKHGSESHFERVSKEHGITFDELIKKYNENDNTNNRIPA